MTTALASISARASALLGPEGAFRFAFRVALRRSSLSCTWRSCIAGGSVCCIVAMVLLRCTSLVSVLFANLAGFL